MFFMKLQPQLNRLVLPAAFPLRTTRWGLQEYSEVCIQKLPCWVVNSHFIFTTPNKKMFKFVMCRE